MPIYTGTIMPNEMCNEENARREDIRSIIVSLMTMNVS